MNSDERVNKLADRLKALRFEDWLREIGKELEAAYQAGSEAMRERAMQVAEEEGKVAQADGGNVVRWDACDNVAREIRALKLQTVDSKEEGRTS